MESEGKCQKCLNSNQYLENGICVDKNLNKKYSNCKTFDEGKCHQCSEDLYMMDNQCEKLKLKDNQILGCRIPEN